MPRSCSRRRWRRAGRPRPAASASTSGALRTTPGVPDPGGAATVLAFDVGSRRIGVAIGNVLSASGRELAVVDVRAGAPDWARIETLLRDWRPDALVVGDPRLLDDESGDQPARRRARGFAREAAARSGLPVWLVDERSTSMDAARRFAAGRAAGARRRSQARDLDALAAVIILERWFEAPEDAEPASA
ncbi:Holliday junction resolvase RuvX [Coralloluteibacterium stylophorae]|uniref:Putative pre-16S rRNA nuclease n=1 Tax=Coralloluteibacterium stylophorae TaxID=1776034 RepID=A0AAP2C825_9GAMM|nr:Holliday junction resolvase RuvX [Coralloluteibacterium stylophorae]